MYIRMYSTRNMLPESRKRNLPLYDFFLKAFFQIFWCSLLQNLGSRISFTVITRQHVCRRNASHRSHPSRLIWRRRRRRWRRRRRSRLLCPVNSAQNSAQVQVYTVSTSASAITSTSWPHISGYNQNWLSLISLSEDLFKNIATGETSWAIASSHF